MITVRATSLSRSELLRAVWDEPMGKVAARVGMTANGLAKLCDRLDVPRPTRGYWNLSPAERRDHRRRAVRDEQEPKGRIEFGGPPRQRRARTRLSIDQRRSQLLDLAAKVVLEEGAGQASLKRIAREAGITEAQAHNCFGKRIDMLLALTRRELDAVERARRDVVERGRDYVTAVVLSTMSYLDEAELRGPLLQALLMVPEVREALRAERQANRSKANEPVLLRMRRRYNFSDDEALCSNAILSAICLRTGGMLATRRITRPVANRLCLSMVLNGMRSNAAVADRAGN